MCVRKGKSVVQKKLYLVQDFLIEPLFYMKIFGGDRIVLFTEYDYVLDLETNISHLRSEGSLEASTNRDLRPRRTRSL